MGTGRPLVTESLEEKLERHLPGAHVVGASATDWLTYDCAGRVIATGHSKREAVDVAVALWGVR